MNNYYPAWQANQGEQEMNEQGMAMPQQLEQIEQPQEPQGGLLDESGTIDAVLDGISDYLHGEARDQIAGTLADQEIPLDESVAAMAYSTLTQAVDQVEGADPSVLEMDNLLFLATETIDFLLEIADAVGKDYDPQEIRERSFFELIQLHMARMEGDPEQQEIARQMLEEMAGDGTLDQAEKYITDRVKATGGDPAQMDGMAQQMMQPRQDPLAGAVQQGLMQTPAAEYDYAPGGM